MDGHKVVGLIIDPKTLSNIRANRMSVMGVEGEQTAYNNLRVRHVWCAAWTVFHNCTACQPLIGS